MNKYKVGDKFIVEIEEIYNGDLVKHEEHIHLHRIKGFNSLVLDEYGLDKLQQYEEEVIATKFYEKGRQEALEEVQNCESYGYEKGLNDAWELARKLELNECDGGFSSDTIAKAFGCTVYDTFRLFTPKQAIAKIEAYEKSQQIQVGDVVKVRTGAGSEHLGVVTQITANQNCACIVYADGSTEMNTANNMTKTNKHLDIEHLLEQIRGNE